MGQFPRHPTPTDAVHVSIYPAHRAATANYCRLSGTLDSVYSRWRTLFARPGSPPSVGLIQHFAPTEYCVQ